MLRVTFSSFVSLFCYVIICIVNE